MVTVFAYSQPSSYVILKRTVPTEVNHLDRYCKYKKGVGWRKELFWIDLKLFGEESQEYCRERDRRLYVMHLGTSNLKCQK
jgi:hypothetical protein